MEMKCEVLERDSRFEGVVKVRVPGIYGSKGRPLPKRMSKLVRPAAVALRKVYRDIVREGGHLYISEMFRSASEQQKAHQDWKSGRKNSYSPPSCHSVHEAARAIDIDAYDTGIGHRRVREILNQHGWLNIVRTLTGPECWHYEFRQERWEQYKKKHSYAVMAHAMKEEISNLVGQRRAEGQKEEIRWLQQSLNRILGTRLVADGIYGEKTREAVKRFQRRYRLQVDGVAGPITRKKIKEVLKQEEEGGAPGEPPSSGEEAGSRLYGQRNDGVRDILLTFDDGPNPRTTPKLLDILAEHGIKAVFFVVGQRLATSAGKRILRRTQAEGHLIGNHTYSHPNLRHLSREEIKEELQRTHELICSCTGHCDLFRPPYGATNQLVAEVLQELDYQPLLWNVDTMDWKYRQEGEWVDYGMEQIRAREDSLVLMHDIHSTTVDYVEQLITLIRDVPRTKFVLS